MNEVIRGEYKFVRTAADTVHVYHWCEYRIPIARRNTTGWLSCSEGWYLRADGKWHETRRCGYDPDRIVDSIEDIYAAYPAA